MEFNRYQHVEKFGNDEVDGIELGTCYIFPKIDGTNGSVWNDKSIIKAGSRNRELTLEKDNANFYSFILEQQNIIELLVNYPNLRLYGEWLVPHTLKTYRDNTWRKFYVFDVIEEMEEGDFRYLTYEEYQPILEEYKIDYLAPLKIIKNPTYEDLLHCLEINTTLMKDGEIGEGIVIKNYSFVNKYGRITWAKIVRSEFKEKHHREMGSPKLERHMVEQEIVDEYVTSALIEKTYAKIVVDGWNSKKITELLNRVFYDLVNEEIWNIVKKFKQPKIDFKTLNTLTILKIKEVKKELF
ncbi:MAG: RNA ligase family protein [Novosphingobium sp.]|nr:RNA ligase family protein [Novosphingobium sp.]